MRHVKAYENIRQSRVVNITQLWRDYNKYYSQVYPNDPPRLLSYYFEKSLLPRILQDKDAEFKCTDCVSNNDHAGRIKKLKIIIDVDTPYEKSEVRSEIELYDDNNVYVVSGDIRVYGSSLTRDEERINKIKREKRFGL